MDRLTLFLPDLAGGGAERVLINLAGAFRQRGYLVDLVVARTGGELASEIPQRVRLVTLGVARPSRGILRFASYLRRARPVGVLSTLYHANVAMRCATLLSGVTVNSVVREANTLSEEILRASTFDQMVVPLLIRLLYATAQVVTVSRSARQDFISVSGLPEEIVHVIYNPVLGPGFRSRASERPEHPWLPANQVPVVITAGRLCYQKGFDVLLEAFASLRKRRRVRLIILGEGELRAVLQEQIARLGITEDCDLPGFRRNAVAFIANASVFALASRWEGLSNVLIESLACGVPIVATDCPSGSAEILGAGRFGRLVAPEAPGELADAMEEALDVGNPQPVPKEWLVQFDVNAVADAYLKLLTGSGQEMS